MAVGRGGRKSNKKAKLNNNPHLPDDLIESILLRLPIKDLCQFSLLSRRFRYSWKFCRDLSFDSSTALSKDQFRAAVTHVLRNHSTTVPAERFHLRYDAAGDTKLVRYWIQLAVALGITKFELDFTLSPNKFMLSSNIIAPAAVTVMKLSNCELHLPIAFPENNNSDHATTNGLRHLRDLTFENMRARPHAVQAVFRNCLELVSLTLVNCSSVYALRINAEKQKGFKSVVVQNCSDVHSVCLNAPTMETFHYQGKICELEFQIDLPQLNEVSINFAHPRGFQLIPHRKKTFNALAHVRILTVSSIFLEGWEGIALCMWRLKEFNLVVAPESYVNPWDVAMFLNKCPSIECVKIELGHNAFNGDGHYWKTIGRKNLSEYNAVFPLLKYVKIKGFTMTEQAIMMGRFFLKAGVFLQKLVIVKARNHNNGKNVGSDVKIQDWLTWGMVSNAKLEIYDYHQVDKLRMP